jgi:hypothetical protein
LSGAFFPKPPPDFPFPSLPKPNPSLNLPFPSVESPSGYKNRARDPSSPSYSDAEHWNHPETTLPEAPP